jgi:membrane-associated phospholipid phosphatase
VRTANRAWAIAAAAGAGVAATYVVAVRTASGQQADTRAMHAVADAFGQPEWAGSVLSLVSPLTVLCATVVLTIVAALVRGRRIAVAVAGTVIGTVVAARLLKELLDRPMWWDPIANSLPSGHVAAVAGLVVAALSVVRGDVRRALALPGAAAVATTGLATVVLTWHRPSDVIAAVLLALAVGATARGCVGETTRSRFDRRELQAVA